MPASVLSLDTRRLIVLILTLCCWGTALANNGKDATRARLQLVESQIQQLERRLADFHKERDGLQRELRRAETALGRIQGKMSAIREELTFKQNQLRALTDQRAHLLASRIEQQALIARDITTAYQVGREGKLKLLLNQGEPHTMARALAYYEYFNKARNQRIDDYMEIVTRIDAIEPEILQATVTLRASQHELTEQQVLLERGRADREKSLAALSATIRTEDQQLKQLTADRAELERLLSAIEEAVAELDIPISIGPFAESRGKMPWPVSGKPRNRFGRTRDGGPLRWEGLLIPAKEGTEVGAIHHGRVVFADWFRGSGLLLILDHGDGYMSLYGHNQSLLREVGEWVAAGDAIATVGNSGGQQQSALYFEVRTDGQPTDPRSWCKKG